MSEEDYQNLLQQRGRDATLPDLHDG